MSDQFAIQQFVGKQVAIVGTSRSDLNGLEGVATEYDHEKKRYNIELDNGAAVLLKAANMEVISDVLVSPHHQAWSQTKLPKASAAGDAGAVSGRQVGVREAGVAGFGGPGQPGGAGGGGQGKPDSGGYMPGASPVDIVVGSRIDFYSKSNKVWFPALITDVDPESGAVSISCKPKPLSRQEQENHIRPRTKPDETRLEFLRTAMREGRMLDLTRPIFKRHAQPTEMGPLLLSQEAAYAVGLELDDLLGLAGSYCTLVYTLKEYGKVDEDIFVSQVFKSVEYIANLYSSALECEHFFKATSDDPFLMFNFKKKLGSGTFGTAFEVERKDSPGVIRAIKQIPKDKLKTSMAVNKMHLEPEIEHLISLDHPHIVRLYECIAHESYVYLVMDFCSGGDIDDALRNARVGGRALQETWVATVMMQCLSAISFCHVRGIMHLDLKPANVMLMPAQDQTLGPSDDRLGDVSAVDRPHAVVIDLGIAQRFKPGAFEKRGAMGTPNYMAPEIWEGTQTPKADVFSLGIMCFEMLSLVKPYQFPDKIPEYKAFWKAQPEPQVTWDYVTTRSDRAISLCRVMLEVNRDGRATAPECLQHAFINRVEISGVNRKEPPRYTVLPQRIVDRLKLYPERDLLHNSIALNIARSWPANRLPTIKRFFQELDHHGNSCLDREVFEKCLLLHGIPQQLARKIFEAVDLNGKKRIYWSEFVAACLHLGSVDLEGDLYNVFMKADFDSDGFLVWEDIKELLPANKQRSSFEDMVDECFFLMAGVRDRGALIDWPTFLKFFRSDEDHRRAVNEQKKRAIREGRSASPAPPAPPPQPESNRVQYASDSPRCQANSESPLPLDTDKREKKEKKEKRRSSNSPRPEANSESPLPLDTEKREKTEKRRSSNSPAPEGKPSRRSKSKSPKPDKNSWQPEKEPSGRRQSKSAEPTPEAQAEPSGRRQSKSAEPTPEAQARRAQDLQLAQRQSSTPPPPREDDDQEPEVCTVWSPDERRSSSPRPYHRQVPVSRLPPAPVEGKTYVSRISSPATGIMQPNTAFAENLQKMQEVGLMDKDRNREALIKHNNVLSKAVYTIMAQDVSGTAC